MGRLEIVGVVSLLGRVVYIEGRVVIVMIFVRVFLFWVLCCVLLWFVG